MRRKSKLMLLVGLACALAGSMGLLVWHRSKKGKRQTYALGGRGKRAAAQVVVDPVTPRDLEHRIEETATVGPARVHPVGVEIAGRVTEVRFEVGRHVRRGELLVVLDAEQVELALAEASQNKARAELDLARATQDLTQTEQLSRLLVQERADQLTQVAVDRQKAKDDLERQRELHGRKIASATELADAQAKLKGMEAAHALARTRVELERARQRQAVEVARHKLAAARVALALADNATARTRLEQRRHRIVAPAAGVVVARSVEVGQRTAAGAEVARIAQVDPVLLEVGLTEAELLQVRQGVARRSLKLECRVPEIGWNQPLTLELIESRLVPMAGQTRTYACWFLTGNAGGRLIPGMTVRLVLATGVTRRVLAIPRRALREIHGKPYVFLARGGQAVLTAVEVSGYQDGMALIAAGLATGDRLIVQGPSTLADRAPIREGRASGKRGA